MLLWYVRPLWHANFDFGRVQRSSTRVPRKLDLLAARGLFLSLLSSERFFDAMHAFNNMQLQLRYAARTGVILSLGYKPFTGYSPRSSLPFSRLMSNSTSLGVAGFCLCGAHAVCRLLPDTREEIPAYFAAPYDARLIAGLLDALVFLLQQLLAQGYLVRVILNELCINLHRAAGPPSARLPLIRSCCALRLCSLKTCCPLSGF